MRNFLNSTKWKTDPRAAYIPPACMVFFVLVICMAAGPAWSFETVHGHLDGVTPAKIQDVSTHSARHAYKSPSSPVQVDTCLPLLSSAHPQVSNRTQRSAGKAAALGLVFGVRFALSPPKKAASREKGMRIGLWQPQSVLEGNRSALAVSAYRECQKDKALQALSDFRWRR